MRELTFEGFLKKYVAELSDSHKTGIAALVKEVESGNARLLEPLVLYAVFSGKRDLFYKLINDTALKREVLRFESEAEALKALESGGLPYGYVKVWNSYKTVKNRQNVDDNLKTLMRERIRKLQKQKNITNYRIYTALGMNPGNINSWLKNGDCKKVGLDASRKVLNFVENYPAR